MGRRSVERKANGVPAPLAPTGEALRRLDGIDALVLAERLADLLDDVSPGVLVNLSHVLASCVPAKPGATLEADSSKEKKR